MTSLALFRWDLFSKWHFSVLIWMQLGFQTTSLAVDMVFDEGQNKWDALKINDKPITAVPEPGLDLSELEEKSREFKFL